MICGEVNVSANMGGVTSDGKILCGLCFTSAELDKTIDLAKYTSEEIINFYIEQDYYFKPTKVIETHLDWGQKQILVQFDDERELWRMIPHGKSGYRKEAWLFSYSDIIKCELIKYGKHVSSCDSLKIKVTIDDINGSAVYITFIDKPLDVKKDSKRYLKIITSADDCLSTFLTIKENL